jgi:hypothetical protein
MRSLYCLCICASVCPQLPLLCNSSVNTFPRQRMHATIKELFGRSVFYALRVVLSAQRVVKGK